MSNKKTENDNTVISGIKLSKRRNTLLKSLKLKRTKSGAVELNK